MARERIHKILARSGYASRRKAEEWIARGRVTLNGRVVTAPGTSADPEKDVICLDGTPVRSVRRRVTLMLNKPPGVVTTMNDPQGRPTVRDLVADVPRRLFPVGRLDADSEGLLLMTDDGDLALRVQHPRYEVPKTYEVYVDGLRHANQLLKLQQGVPGDPRLGKVPRVDLLRRWNERALIRIRIAEGKKRQVRRMCAHAGLEVLRLRRVAIGSLGLGSLPKGAYRILKDRDIRMLLQTRPPETKRADTGSQGHQRKPASKKGLPRTPSRKL